MECQEPIKKKCNIFDTKIILPWIKIEMPEDDFDKSFSTLISKLGKTPVF